MNGPDGGVGGGSIVTKHKTSMTGVKYICSLVTNVAFSYHQLNVKR